MTNAVESRVPAHAVVRPMQPYAYPPKREFVEPDWTRWPGFADVTRKEWESALWQRKNSVKNVDELRRVWGKYASLELMQSIEDDIDKYGTMSMLIPPQMINCMNEKVQFSIYSFVFGKNSGYLFFISNVTFNNQF